MMQIGGQVTGDVSF